VYFSRVQKQIPFSCLVWYNDENTFFILLGWLRTAGHGTISLADGSAAAAQKASAGGEFTGISAIRTLCFPVYLGAGTHRPYPRT